MLPPGKLALRKITDPAQIPDYTLACSDTDRLREAIANSLNYLAKPSSKQHYPYGDIPYEQAVKSLRELDRLVAMRLPPREMNSVLRERFDTYISVGCDDQGTVLFTGYYTPIFDGSSTRTDRFRHPLYKPPVDLIKGVDGASLGRKGPDGRIRPYPSREEIQRANILDGNELVWLGDPFEVYIAHVQGSAKIRMPGGRLETVGYAAAYRIGIAVDRYDVPAMRPCAPYRVALTVLCVTGCTLGSRARRQRATRLTRPARRQR